MTQLIIFPQSAINGPDGKVSLEWQQFFQNNPAVAAAVSETLTDLAASSGAGLIGFIQAGSGTKAVTVQSKLREWVSVADFTGADSTGATSSSAAFQSAGNVSQYQTVLVPPGTWKLDTSPTFTAGFIPLFVFESGAVLTGAGILSGYQVQLGAQVTPVGNAITTDTAISSQITTQIETVREYTATFGMTATKGSTQNNSGPGDKCVLYAGIEGKTGGGNIWAFNPLVTIDTGWTGCTGGALQSACVAELDLNNNSGTNYGPTSGSAYGNPSATGLLITGAGSNRCTAAMQVLGQATGPVPMWSFGTWYGNDSVLVATICDTTNSSVSHYIQGSHTYNIDMAGSTVSSSAIRLGNAQNLSWRNAANNADIVCMVLSNSNNLTIGVGAAGIFADATTSPQTDNTYTCGQNGNRWSAVWAANGTIQTSDPRLKTEIKTLPDALPIVQSIQPRTFKWIVGGQEATESELPDGTKQKKITQKSGKRTHWGFLAPEIKEAFDAIGMDFGGYVKGEDGTEAMRPDQLIPVLWKAVQELAAEVARLSMKVAK